MVKVKAVRVHSLGGSHSVLYEDVEIKSPPEGHVEIRHTAIPATSDDETWKGFSRSGNEYPFTLGESGVGVITEIGAGVLNHQIGQRVAYVNAPNSGSFCELRIISSAYLIPLPDFINDDQVASVLYEGMVAWMLVKKVFPIRRGDTVLIHDVTSGLGSLLCQFAKHLGAVVVGTVQDKSDFPRADKVGVNHVIGYTDFGEKVMQLTNGAGVAVVYDSWGKNTITGSLSCLAPRGMFVVNRNEPGFSFSEVSEKGKSISVAFPLLQDYVGRREDVLEASAELFALLKSQTLSISMKEKLPLHKAKEVLEGIRTMAHFDTVILSPPITEPKDFPHGS